jgi:Alr-MurF fusion protein
MSYTLKEIASMSGGDLVGNDIGTVVRLVFDSRLVFETEGVLFIALRGGFNDGHKFIPELYTKGVRSFMVNHNFQLPGDMHDAAFVIVDDTLEGLQSLAAAHRARFKVPVLAITGSNGKTIVKEWLGQVLGDDENLARSPRSYNSQIGVPLSVWQMSAKTTLGLFEAGISQPGEMGALREIIQPNLGLITNIGTAHQENFHSLNEKLLEKLQLFKDVDVVFYNSEQEDVHRMMTELYSEKTKLTWGKTDKAELQLISTKVSDVTRMRLKWKDKLFDVSIPFADAISVENVLPVVLFMLYKNYSMEEVASRLLQLQPVAMRMEQKEGINGSLIINDSYNSDFTSLETALDFLEQQGRRKGSKKTLILSDMFQTGLDDSVLYPRVAALIRARNIDRLIGVGADISRYSGCFRQDDTFFHSTEALLLALSELSFRNEAVLVKGARSFTFERIVEMLELKQHSTVLEINLDALVNNLNVFREQLNPATKVLVMVKAFGYGSGSHEIAGALQRQKADYLGVAFADEGVELRQAGITLPIMVMNPELKSFHQILRYNMEPEIYSFRVLGAFSRAVLDNDTNHAFIHIKIDTGMFRLGFLKEELPQLLDALMKMPHLKVRSVFSHLVGSDEEGHDVFTNSQIASFTQMCQELEDGLGYSFMRHVLNSAGVERFPQAQFDMVRLGIGMYGVSAVNNPKLLNVTTLKTYISQVKSVPEEATIGYGRNGKVVAGGRVAVIPIGYADGLNRHLSNRRYAVLVNDSFAPIVGNICMDMCMIDVTGIQVQEGDEVIVFGDNHSFLQMAQTLNTIPYEILTGISRRVKRVYFRE